MFMMIGLLCIGGLAMTTMSLTESVEGEDAAVAEEDTTKDAPPSHDEGSLLDVVAAGLQEVPSPEDGAPPLLGSEGNETLEGGEGDDTILAGGGNDELLGGGGADILVGGEGEDIAVGDEGDDSLFGGEGDDALHARAGNDLLNGGVGEDSLFGGEGDDTLYGGDDAEDYLIGAEGDDVLIAGKGDHAYGGEGNDTFVLFDPIATGGAVDLADFDAKEDVVVILLDPGEMDVEVELTELEDNPNQTDLRVNGESVATFAQENAPDLADIQLIASNAEITSMMQ